MIVDDVSQRFWPESDEYTALVETDEVCVSLMAHGAGLPTSLRDGSRSPWLVHGFSYLTGAEEDGVFMSLDEAAACAAAMVMTGVPRGSTLRDVAKGPTLGQTLDGTPTPSRVDP